MRLPRWLVVTMGALALYGVGELALAVKRYAPEFLQQLEDASDALEVGASPFLPPI